MAQAARWEVAGLVGGDGEGAGSGGRWVGVLIRVGRWRSCRRIARGCRCPIPTVWRGRGRGWWRPWRGGTLAPCQLQSIARVAGGEGKGDLPCHHPEERKMRGDHDNARKHAVEINLPMSAPCHSPALERRAVCRGPG